MIKYIFSINTGRTGSLYLSKLFGTFDYIHSEHEGDPIGQGLSMIQFNNGNIGPMVKVVEQKMQNIREGLKSSKVYFESNHTFIKGFGWLIPNYIDPKEIGVIVLNRDRSSIINSFLRIRCTPLNYNGRFWILNPLDSSNRIGITFLETLKVRLLYFINRLIHSKYMPVNIKKPDFINRNEIKYLNWYIDETKARKENFIKSFPDIKVYETTVDELNKIENIHEMFDFFGLDFKMSPQLEELVGKKANQKPQFK